MKSDWTIERYQAADAAEWDGFVDSSRNATFLFRRGYMDYHADRFEDCSWIVRKRGRIVALLPANLTSDGVLHSHQGLTYGGWLLPPGHVDAADLLEFFEAAADIWRSQGIVALDYKPLPWIYSEQPSDEAEYALFMLGASVSGVNVSEAICHSRGMHLNQQMRRNLAKAEKFSPDVEETDDIEAFMSMLAECLERRHAATPVHTAAEMRLLRDRFPDNIRFFTARPAGGAIEAGVCVFDTGRVAHAQYIASTEEGRAHNMLVPLFKALIADIFAERTYFDFGTCNADGGRYLNAGLLRQKFSYGATAVSYRRFHLPL